MRIQICILGFKGLSFTSARGKVLVKPTKVQVGSATRVSLEFSSLYHYMRNFLQFDWLRARVFQLNLKYLHVKITNLLRVVV